MTMPWTFDALLPADKRYTSLKFRRAGRQFDASRLDYADAAELCAFVETIDLKHARWIFQWRGAGVREMDRLLKHLSADPTVGRMVHDNHEAVTRSDGLAVLQAMKDGGWRQGSVPGVVRMALLDMRDAGISQPKIAAQVGLTVDQVRNAANGPRWVRAARSTGLLGLVAQ